MDGPSARSKSTPHAWRVSHLYVHSCRGTSRSHCAHSQPDLLNFGVLCGASSAMIHPLAGFISKKDFIVKIVLTVGYFWRSRCSNSVRTDFGFPLFFSFGTFQLQCVKANAKMCHHCTLKTCKAAEKMKGIPVTSQAFCRRCCCPSRGRLPSFENKYKSRRCRKPTICESLLGHLADTKGCRTTNLWPLGSTFASHPHSETQGAKGQQVIKYLRQMTSICKYSLKASLPFNWLKVTPCTCFFCCCFLLNSSSIAGFHRGVVLS